MRKLFIALSLAAIIAAISIFILYFTNTASERPSDGHSVSESQTGREEPDINTTPVSKKGEDASLFVIVAFPPAFLGMIYLALGVILPMFIYRGDSEKLKEKTEIVMSSGTCLASIKTSGRISWVNFNGPFLDFSIYPGGLWIKPVMMAPIGILKEEITGVRRKSGVFVPFIFVDHKSPEAASPIVIYTRNQKIVETLEDMTGMEMGR